MLDKKSLLKRGIH